MIRLICRETDCGAAANVGGPVEVSHKTFEIDIPVVEQWLREHIGESFSYYTRSIVGFEFIEQRTPGNDQPTESDIKF